MIPDTPEILLTDDGRLTDQTRQASELRAIARIMPVFAGMPLDYAVNTDPAHGGLTIADLSPTV